MHRSGDGGGRGSSPGRSAADLRPSRSSRGNEVAAYAAVAQKGIGASEDGGRTVSMRYAGDAP